MKRAVTWSRVSVIVLFIALIRCIGETFRLRYFSPSEPDFQVLKPFLLASIFLSILLLACTILSWTGRHKIIMALGVTGIIILVWIKVSFGIQS